MYVSHLSLVDFRSYPTVELPIERGVTTFIGPNGQGKTNLVEAIAYVATLASHRVATDGPLVRVGAERAIVRTVIQRDDRATLVELEVTPGRANRARVNRSPVPRPREVLGLLRTVMFAPEDLALVKGDPSERRRFLDELLVARTPRLAGVRADYDRVLKQRNALLKSAGAAVKHGRPGADVRTLEVWDSHLAEHGAALLAARLELVTALRPLVDKAYDSISSGHGPTALDYASSLGPQATLEADRLLLAAALLDGMAGRRKDELDRGVSLVGPHRDDLVLRLGPSPAKGYASHGEAWSYALALRLASYDLLNAEGDEPVLILDDVFAELDDQRRNRLGELVAAGTQVLVTAAVPDDVPGRLSGTRVDVMAGEVHRVL